MPTRKASATWEGKIRDGQGSFDGESGAVGGAYSFGSRFEEGQGSNPEELLAAAEAACFSMALAGNLERAGTPPTQVHTDAACTVERAGDGFKITRIRLKVRARVPGVEEETFRRVAEETKNTCPVSVALKGNVELELETQLEDVNETVGA